MGARSDRWCSFFRKPSIYQGEARKLPGNGAEKVQFWFPRRRNPFPINIYAPACARFRVGRNAPRILEYSRCKKKWQKLYANSKKGRPSWTRAKEFSGREVWAPPPT